MAKSKVPEYMLLGKAPGGKGSVEWDGILWSPQPRLPSLNNARRMLLEVIKNRGRPIPTVSPEKVLLNE